MADDVYTCSNGNLIKNGENLGRYTEDNPYDLGGGVKTWCNGNRVVAVFPVHD